jgi:(heptosyl)LPS beta-1,4-glucosyltransferase
MADLTVVVLTKDEEAYIGDCLESLKWCPQVVVLDSFSSDQTVEIARQRGTRVAQRNFINFADQRNAGIDLVDSEWIFFVDADERVTPELAEEVSRVIENPEYDGWWVPRKSNYFGKWLKYGGFSPDYQLRTARKRKYHFDPTQKVHEKPIVDGKVGYLKNPLIHYCYQNLSELKKAGAIFNTLMAEVMFEQGRKPTYHFIIAPIMTLLRQACIKQGYRDGWNGLLLSLAMSYNIFDAYRRLWILWYKH